MRETIDIHNYALRLEKMLSSFKKSKEINEKNKELILEFANNCLAESISKGRVIKYVCTLKTLAKLLEKSFEDVERQDVINTVARIEQSDYSEWTKKDFKVTLKKFFKWLRKTEDYPHEVRWLKASMKNEKKLLPDEILTEEEIKKIASASLNARDRALALVLYESGARVGEFLGLRAEEPKEWKVTSVRNYKDKDF